MNLVVRKRIVDENIYYNYPFRRCTIEDFKKRGLKAHEKLLNQYTKRFCPELGSGNDEYQVKNLYDNENERVSFSVEIYRCDRSKHSCVPEYKINDFFK